MCFCIITTVEIILKVLIYYCSATMTDIKISSDLLDSSHVIDLADVATDLLYSSLAHPQSIIIPYDKNNRSDLKLLKYLQSRSSVIVLNEDFSMKGKIVHSKKINAGILLINNYNHESLTTTLLEFTKTSWSNPSPTFFTIYNDLDNCSFAHEILRTMWKFRIISYLICLDKEEDILIFTFNPFTDQAPSLWQIVHIAPYRNGKWTLLVCKYQRVNTSLLAFDRTQVLDGYKLNFGFVGIESSTHTSQNKSLCVKNESSKKYMDAIMMTLNLPGKFHCFPLSRNVPNYKREIAKRIFKSDVDIISGGVVAVTDSHSLYDFERTVPGFGYQWGILTINRGYKTPIEKIRDFYGIWVLLFTIFVLLVTFVVIYFVEERRIYFATLEIIRLLIGTNLHTEMNTPSLRLFFTVIFIYFLVMQATFNGNLPNFLTKPTLRRHPETLEDLQELGYKHIYGIHSLNYSMPPDIKFISTNECWTRLENRTDTACINIHDHLLGYIADTDHTFYHVSRKPFGTYYRYLYVRSNWVLADKVNQAIIRVWQSGLQLHWVNFYYAEKTIKAKAYEARSLFVFAKIKLNNLIFAFMILGSGLLCAALAFLIELSIVYIR